MTDKNTRWGWIRKALARALMSLGVLSLILMVMSLITLSRFFTAPPPELPQKIVLRYVLEEGLYETQEAGLSDFELPFASADMTVQDMIRAINTGANDKRVQGLVLRIKEGQYGLAHIQSLRRSIKAFQQKGKFAHVYATSYGMTSGSGSYYLASAFDDIWLQPIGVVGINGFAYQVPFFKQLLDKVGITPDIIQIGDYKSSAENMTRQSMSKEHRDMMEDIIGNYYEQFVADISKDRNIPQETLKNLIDTAPINGKKALEHNLVNHIGYMDQFIDAIDAITGKDVGWVDLSVYNKAVRSAQKKFKNHIAVIHVDGPIMDTTGKGSGLLGEMSYDLGDILHALEYAAEDKHINAIVLRINSPGGTPEASETLRRAVTLALEKKPVVVSMGNMAASGGYWAAVNGSRIFAEPMTLTGSIGVFGGKISMGGLLDKIGINIDTVQEGKHATIYSPTRPFTPQEEKTVRTLMQDIYDTFLKRVAHGRGMDLETVQSLAQGKVYTGLQAQEVGLVDQIGGLDDAAVAALVLSGGEPKDGLAMLPYPKPRSSIERLFDLIVGGVRAQALAGKFLSHAHKAVQASGTMVYALETSKAGL